MDPLLVDAGGRRLAVLGGGCVLVGVSCWQCLAEKISRVTTLVAALFSVAGAM
jgi:hypothetical protein